MSTEVAHARLGSAAIERRRPLRHVGPVHVVQLVTLEAAALGVLLALLYGTPAAVGAAAAAVAVAALTFIRRRGRWLPETVLLRARARTRRRLITSARPGGQDAPRPTHLANLRLLAPQLVVQDVQGPQQLTFGVGYDGEGWFAAAVVTDAQTGGPAQVPASALGSMLGPHRVPGGAVVAEPLAASVQVVTLTDTESRPSHPSWPLVPAAEGEPFVPGPTLGSRTTWIAVRVDARPLAELGPGVRAAPGPQQAPPELAQLVRRLDRQLDAEGIRVQVLDASGLIGALSRCCFPVPADPPAGEEPAVQPVAPQELRAAWRSPWREHAGLWLERWPQPKDAQRLLSQLSGAAAAQTLVSLRVAAAAASAEPRFDVRGLVVVATRPGELDAACAEVQALAAAAGGRLFRLDGEHAPALYAAAPSGGGPR